MRQAILIMVDTQRWDMLSCYHPKAFPTPNLDRLAESGTLFERGYTCQPVCGPARSAIFTGLYPHTNGMETNCVSLRDNIKVASEWLAPHNIDCGYIGKWHLDGGDYFGYGKPAPACNPKYWYDGRNFLDSLPLESSRRLSRKNMNSRLDDPLETDTFAHQCCDRAIAYLDEYKDKDFFLTLSLDEPHDPSICPRRFVNMIRSAKYTFHRTPNIKAKLDDKPAHQQVWSKCYRRIPFKAMTRFNKALFACNAFCDYEIGRVLDKVKSLGIAPLIIYTADHGDMLLSHGLMGKGCVMYDEITRIPYIISGGGFVHSIAKAPVSHIDLLPTIMTHLGVTVPAMLSGKALQTLNLDAPRTIFMEFTRYEVDHDGFMGFQPIRAAFDGRYKLVINLLTSDELYDLENDCYEQVNLIEGKTTATIRNSLHDKIIQHMNVTRDFYRGYYWECRSWRPLARPSFHHTGYTRQQIEEDFVQCDYSTGMPMTEHSRKK